MPKLNFVHSEAHTVFPKIIIGVIIFFAAVMLVQALLKAKREKKPLFSFAGKRFFKEDYDRKKLFGSMVLLVLYIICLPLLTFIPASIVFISLFNILYENKMNKKAIAISIATSAVEVLAIWYVFGYWFEITLP